MKKVFRYFLLLLAIFTSKASSAQEFDKYFSDSTLRIDYILTGNVNKQSIALDGMSRMPGWYGKRQNMTSFPVHGAATITMTLASTHQVIYRHTFSTLFQEWLDLDDAKQNEKAFECVELLPMPRNSVIINVTLYNSRQQSIASIEHSVSPKDYTIRRIGEKNVAPFVVLSEPDDPNHAINVAFVAEGYTQEQMEDYLADCRKATEGLFSFEPYKAMRGRFRITAVCTPSQHSGPSIPSEGVWHNTTIGSSFDTFGMARYLTTLRIKQMHDAMAGTPYEHIVALVNTDRYGGGGIYNTLDLLMTKHKLFIEVFVHEFGHSFAGLADEYAYEGEEPNDYPLNIEPWAPNITTLTQFDRKWKSMLPDPNNINILTTSNSNLDTESIGLYEGAGCVLKGVYRPCPNCMMRTLKVPKFCPVCKKTIQDIIDFYTKP